MHLGWGKRTDRNVVEQAGLLVGHRYLDPNGEAFAIVEHVLEAQFGESSSGAITLTHETWFDLLNRLDALPVPDGATAWQIIGWYHTHPNTLPVFMSGTDRRTQRDFFAGPEYFAFVLNPHTRLWAAFRGGDCEECCAVAKRDTTADDDLGQSLLTALIARRADPPPLLETATPEPSPPADEPADRKKRRKNPHKQGWSIGRWFDRRA